MVPVEYTEVYLQKYWDLFNARYFDGKLKQVPLKWSNHMKNWGLTYSEYDYNANKIITTKILLNKKAMKTFDRFRLVLVHEMVHQWVYQNVSQKEINEVIKSGVKPQSSKFWYKLRLSAKYEHLGKWLEKTKELIANFREIKEL
jgi:hypothetical protein